MAITKQLVTHDYRRTQVDNFFHSVNPTDANVYYYAFAGKSTPYANSDTVIPDLYDSVQGSGFGAYQDMVFGKAVTPNDIAYMAPLHVWTSGTVYAQYDDTDPNLLTKAFYVVVSEGSNYYCYKCLYNNGGAPSTSQPTFADTSAADTFYQTADGYQWKYMFTITSVQFSKWSTSTMFPVIPDSNVVANAVAGALDVILVTDPGSGYGNYTNGQFQTGDIFAANQFLYGVSSPHASSTNGYYVGCYMVITGGTGQGEFSTITSYTVNTSGKFVTVYPSFTTTPSLTSTFDISPAVTILGDGNQTVNAAARALVNATSGNAVFKVEMLNRGVGYQYASASVVAANIVGVSNTATLRPVASPRGGHGSEPHDELGVTAAGISITFVQSESNTIPVTNEYRQVGLIKNPLFSNVVITLANPVGSFTAGERVVQQNTGATGFVFDVTGTQISITNATNSWLPGNSTYGKVVGVTSNAQAQVNVIFNNDAQKGFTTYSSMYRYVGILESGSFAEHEVVTLGNTATTNAIFHSYFPNTSCMALVNQLGHWTVPNTVQGTSNGGHFSVTTKFYPDIVINSGEIVYMENVQPRTRSNVQSETIKFIMQF